MAKKKRPNKVTKPHPTFPLFPHQNGSWAKKIRGKIHYFGPHNDHAGALKNYLAQAEALHAGRAPKRDAESVQLREVLNAFLSTKYALVETGELSARHVADYRRTCDLLASHFGKASAIAHLVPQGFEALRLALATRRGPTSLRNELTRIRTVFRYAVDAGVIDSLPKFGPGFHSPSQKSIRKVRNAKGVQMFQSADLRRIIETADGQLRAMVLLAVSAGMGNSDIARFPIAALSRDFKWITYPRPKTEVPRRCPVWPEVREAVKWCLENRPSPAKTEYGELLFLTKTGRPWIRVTPGKPKVDVDVMHEVDARHGSGTVTITDLIAQNFRRLTAKLAIDKSSGGFYSLRRTTQTIGEECGDSVAVSAIMGHAPAMGDMASVYRQSISDERLLRVSQTIHDWLWPPKRKR